MIDHLLCLGQWLRSLLYEEEVNGNGHALWASFDWTKEVDLEEALERQRKLTRFVADRHLVVQTGILEEDTDEWPPPSGRRGLFTRGLPGSQRRGCRQTGASRWPRRDRAP